MGLISGAIDAHHPAMRRPGQSAPTIKAIMAGASGPSCGPSPSRHHAMKYDTDEILQRLRLGEDSGWEFKEIRFSGNRPVAPKRKVWADAIAALANASGGALLCGVTDEGEVQGMSREQMAALDAMLIEVSTDIVKPPVRIETHHRALPDGKSVLVLEVAEGVQLHESPGGHLVRVGGSKKKMSSDESLRLAQRRSQARYLWFDKQPVPDTGFNTLEEQLWKPLLSAEGRADPERALGQMALLANDSRNVPRATVAGVLLCASSPETMLPQACISATCYKGEDRASGQDDAQEITGPLNAQVEAAMAFVVRNMRVAAEKRPARVDRPQYSKRALFEALVNAVVHRDYTHSGSKVRLSMFTDRVEVQSPGTLPNNLTIDSMGERQATRNEALASVFGRLPVNGIHGSEERQYFMERRGDGVAIIRDETLRLSGRLPKYELVDDSELRLAIPAAPLDMDAVQPIITAWSGGKTVPDVDLLVLFPNKTWQRATTDGNGQAAVGLHTAALPMTVFAAKEGYAAHVERGWVPGEGALAMELKPLPDGDGAVIFPESTGHLPKLDGRLNPVRDAHGRTYLYADNIAINQGQQQPVHFALGEQLHLVDAAGRKLWVRIVEVVGRAALLEHSATADPD